MTVQDNKKSAEPFDFAQNRLPSTDFVHLSVAKVKCRVPG